MQEVYNNKIIGLRSLSSTPSGTILLTAMYPCETIGWTLYRYSGGGEALEPAVFPTEYYKIARDIEKKGLVMISEHKLDHFTEKAGKYNIAIGLTEEGIEIAEERYKELAKQALDNLRWEPAIWDLFIFLFSNESPLATYSQSGHTLEMHRISLSSRVSNKSTITKISISNVKDALKLREITLHGRTVNYPREENGRLNPFLGFESSLKDKKLQFYLEYYLIGFLNFLYESYLIAPCCSQRCNSPLNENLIFTIPYELSEVFSAQRSRIKTGRSLWDKLKKSSLNYGGGGRYGKYWKDIGRMETANHKRLDYV